MFAKMYMMVECSVCDAVLERTTVGFSEKLSFLEDVFTILKIPLLSKDEKMGTKIKARFKKIKLSKLILQIAASKLRFSKLQSSKPIF